MGELDDILPSNLDMGLRPGMEFNQNHAAVAFALIGIDERIEITDEEAAYGILDALHRLAIDLSAEDGGVVYPIYRLDDMYVRNRLH